MVLSTEAFAVELSLQHLRLFRRYYMPIAFRFSLQLYPYHADRKSSKRFLARIQKSGDRLEISPKRLDYVLESRSARPLALKRWKAPRTISDSSGFWWRSFQIQVVTEAEVLLFAL